MFSRAEREQYFQAVLAHERAIGHKLQELFHAVQDSDYKGSLEKLFTGGRQGSASILLYGVMQGVVEEESQAYYLIRRFLESLPSSAKNEERRNFFREPLLGLATMRDLGTGEDHRVKCMDISPGGMGIEYDKALPVGHSYDLEIELYKHGVLTTRSGKLVWMREAIPGVFVGGIKFENS